MFGRSPCSIDHCPLPPLSDVWCSSLLEAEPLPHGRGHHWSGAMKGGIHHRSADWCLSQARWWMYTRKHTRMHTHIMPDGECAQWCSSKKENLPWHHPGECRCRAGTGSESQEAWWGRLCHATDRLWERRVKDCELHLAAKLAGASRFVDLLFT